MNTALQPASFSRLQVPKAAAPAAASPPTARELLTILFRHKGKVVVFLLATLAAAVLFTAPPLRTYTSEALLLVRQGRESISLDPTATTGDVVPFRIDWEHALNVEMEILRSREISEGIVDRLGPEPLVATLDVEQPTRMTRLKAWVRAQLGREAETPTEPRSQEDARLTAIDLVGEALSVTRVEKSDIIRLESSTPDPEMSRSLISAMIEVYDERHSAAHSRPGSFQFFTDQTAQLATQLREADDLLRQAKNELGIASLDAEREAITKRVVELRAAKESLDLRLAASARRVASFRAAETNATGRMALPTAYRERQQAIQAEETNLRTLQGESEALLPQLESAQAALKRLNDSEGKVRELQRNRDIIEASYLKYSRHLEEARIDRALESEKISNVSIVQAPTLPGGPQSSDVRLIYLLACLLGSIGGIGIAFMSEGLDQTVRRPDDLENKVQVKALASFPRLARHHLLPRPQRGQSEDKRVLHMTRQAAIHFDMLAQRTLTAIEGAPRPPVLIGLTSCYTGEGVTTLATDLAAALCGMGEPGRGSILIEPDAYHPTSMPFHGRTFGPRATEFVRGESGEVCAIERSVYTLGEEAAEGAATMALQRTITEETVHRARGCQAFFAVFDLPPLSAGVTAERLSAMMDYVILIVESERVRWQTVREAQRRITAAGANLLGAVLNKRRYHIPAWLYRRI